MTSLHKCNWSRNLAKRVQTKTNVHLTENMANRSKLKTITEVFWDIWFEKEDWFAKIIFGKFMKVNDVSPFSPQLINKCTLEYR